MTINPGAYNVFNENGSLFKWGQELVRVEVTTNHRARFYVGDNEEPITERHLPHRMHNMSDFDSYTLQVFTTAMVLYAAKLTERLTHLQAVYQEISVQDQINFSAMMSGLIPAWRWIEKFQELNTHRDICETLLTETMETLRELSPAALTDTFIIVFTTDN